jgi:mannose-6-phosphate isomerase
MEPLYFVPFFEEKPWGGNRMSKLYRRYPSDMNIGESRELSPVLYRQTFVRGGEYDGVMLSDLYKKHHELFGTKTPYFPFVIKMVDINDTIPLIVHGGGLKNDASQIEGVYAVKTDNPVKVVSGTTLKNNLEFFSAIASDTIGDHLCDLYITENDSFVLPPGVLFASGAGGLFYTISSPMMETAYVYDWNKYSDYSPEKVVGDHKFDYRLKKFDQILTDEGRKLVLESEIFRVELIDAVIPVEENGGRLFAAYTALAPGRVTYGESARTFRAGETFVIPAGFGPYTITGGRVLKASPK